MAFFAKVTCDDISKQELRRDVEGITSPSPQPEDHERSLDPGLEEDPDAAVELADGIFYRTSHDGAPVAIPADYLGPLPSSRVSQAENSILRREFFPDVTPYP